MISGQQALATIEDTLREARSTTGELEERIAVVSAQLVELEKATGDDYRELARVRVDRFHDGALEHHLDDAERQVAALFEQRNAALQELETRIHAAQQHRDQLETERKRHAQRVDLAAEAVDTAEALTQSRLENDPQYHAQRIRADEAERQALHANDKATRSEREQEEKGRAFRADPLFMYLWNRGYGLPVYQARGLFRWLDAKVARLIGFSDARANFSRLNEIPLRLRSHANKLEQQAEAEISTLRSLDEAGREKDGIPPLVHALAEAQRALDDIDEEIERSSAQYNELMADKSAFATGDDAFTRKAVEFLASEFKREDVMELRHDALTTPFPDDDLIVARILDRDRKRVELEAMMNGFRDTIRHHQDRLTQLESLRVDFKRNHYDRRGSTFQDSSLIGMMLTQFLQGMLDKQMLWRILQEQQSYRPHQSDPTFGSGGFGRGTVWNGGIGDILGELGRAARAGASRPPRGGGGGFRTGGGF